MDMSKVLVYLCVVIGFAGKDLMWKRGAFSGTLETYGAVQRPAPVRSSYVRYCPK